LPTGVVVTIKIGINWGVVALIYVRSAQILIDWKRILFQYVNPPGMAPEMVETVTAVGVVATVKGN